MENRKNSPIQLSREGLGRALEELADVTVEPEALDRLHQRLVATKEGLIGLNSLIDPELEPLTLVTMEDDGSESR
jgi:hypothetical protein